MTGRYARGKGARRERAILRLLEIAGFAAAKISRAGYTSPDLSIPSIGRDLRCEVKSRGTGFRQLYDWLTKVDLLIVSSDRRLPLVITPFALATQIAKAAQNSRPRAIGTPDASVPANEVQRRPQQMTQESKNALALLDGFDIGDPSASPLRGQSRRFKDGFYYTFNEKFDVEGKSCVVLEQREGWQKLQKGCSPEYLIKQPGEPRPLRPHVDEKDWPLNFNDKPEHPWKYSWYLHLLDTATGEISTFWTNTTGGRIAIAELKDQVSLMRRFRPDAVPVIALQSVPMPTGYGGTKPRPFFKILGYRAISAGARGLITSKVESPSLAEEMNDALPDFDSPTASTIPPENVASPAGAASLMGSPGKERKRRKPKLMPPV